MLETKIDFICLIIIWICVWNLFELFLFYVSKYTKLNKNVLYLLVLILLFISCNHLIKN